MTGAPEDLDAGGAGPPVEELSYTEASRELDEIVRFFEQRDVDVDQLVGRLMRATALVEELDKRLRQTRMQVEQLVPRLAAVRSDASDAAPGAGGPGGGVVTGGRPGGPDGTGGPDHAVERDDELAELDEASLEEMALAEGADAFGEADDRSTSGGGDHGSTPELF